MSDRYDLRTREGRENVRRSTDFYACRETAATIRTLIDMVDRLGRPLELIQHYSQLSILLTALPKIAEKAHRIGFDLDSTTDGGISE